MATAPQVSADCSALPPGDEERSEFKLELFSQHLFYMRNQRVSSISKLVEDREYRERLGTIRRRAYEAVATLDPLARSAAVKLAETAIDLFMQDLLGLFSNTGTALRCGHDRAIRYKLVLEIIDEDRQVISEDVINRGRSKHLPDYFGRWLNTYKNWGRASGTATEPGDEKRSS